MSKRSIKGMEIAQDIHQGLSDSQLMNKYSLSAKQLQFVLRKLLDANLITDMQLFERTSLSDTMVTKAFLDTQTAIHELN